MKKIYLLIMLMVWSNLNKAFAYDMVYRPSLSGSVTWDDNIDDDSVGEKEDVFLAVRPRIRITGRSELSTFNIDGSVSGEAYNKFEENNDISTYRVRGNINYNPSKILSYLLRSTFIFTPSAETERETIFFEGGEAVAPESDVIVRRADRYRFTVDPSVEYSFSTRFSTTLGAGYRTTQYSEKIAGVSDSISYSANGIIDYAFTRRTTGGVDLSFRDIDFEEEEETDAQVYSGTITIEHLYSKNITLFASGGISYIVQENADNEIDFIGEAGSRFRYKNSEYRLEYNRSVREGEFGETITRDRVGASAFFPLSRKTRLRVDGALSRILSSTGDEDLLVKRISARIDYKALEHLSLFISGSSEDQDERAIVGEDVKINRVTAGFVLRAFIEGGSINQ